MITILVLSLFALKKSGPNEIIEAMNEKKQSLNENEKTYISVMGDLANHSLQTWDMRPHCVDLGSSLAVPPCVRC